MNTTDRSENKSASGVGSGALLAVCRNCKFWGPKTDWFQEENPVDVRFCRHPMVCQQNYPEPGRSNVMQPYGVWTPDEGGVTGQLSTGPLFGCRHFSANVRDEPRPI